MWYQEEIESAIYNLRLLDEAVIYVGSLWRIGDTGWGASIHLEESLSYSLVNNYECVLG